MAGHDNNGHSHVRAVIVASSVTLPIVDGHVGFSTAQQLVLVDFGRQENG